ncbi:hypothetical protein NFI96_012574 [Prochilodus magdalenae]|nr:hypothetical protein NFI96_012574 [Prochilodus magdalenae]
MDRLYLLQFLIIQAVLIGVCAGKDGKGMVRCSDMNGTIGEPLTLTCNVTCNITRSVTHSQNCEVKSYKWKMNGTELLRSTADLSNCTFYHTIGNISMEHNTTFSFWVQLSCGFYKQSFSLILSEKKFTAPELSKATSSSSRNSDVAASLICIPVVLLLVGLAVWFRKKCNHGFSRAERNYIDP